MESSVIGPVTTRERIQTIDIIRAFALFGVVVVNFTVDNRGISPAEGRTGFLDQLAYWPIRFFLDDKAMATYCFLFGLGFAIQLVRAQDRNAPVLFMFIRRLVSLFIIGIIFLSDGGIPQQYAMVGVFLLLFYKMPVKFLPALALLCVLGGFARDLIVRERAEEKIKSIHMVTVNDALLDSYTGVYRADHGQVMVIIKKDGKLVGEGPSREFSLSAKSDSEFVRSDGINGIYTFDKDAGGNVTKMGRHSIDGKLISEWPKIQTDLQQALKMQLRKRSGVNSTPRYSSYKEYLKSSAIQVWDRYSNWSWSDFYWGGNQVVDNIQYIFSYFLIGLYVGRRRIFYNISANSEFLKNVMWWGFALGVTGMAINLGTEVWNLTHGLNWSNYSPVARIWFEFSWSTGVMATAFAYVAGLTVLLEKPAWKKRLSFLAPVGRMGFTNYLLHIVVIVFIFPCGFQLDGKIGPFYRLLLALPVYGLLIPLSHWWFKHFVMGPVEWLWRSATYWKWQPLRLKR